MKILLTGATGYVGGRLLEALEAEGCEVRCLAREPSYARAIAARTEVVRGDVLDADSLEAAFEDIDAAYYLIHSMGSQGDFEERDRQGARNFAEAARRAGVERIIYLGGLGAGSDLSPHLRSRQEVGEILRAGGVPTLELRASIIIGSGSLSFELVRALVEKLPLMVTPRWVKVRAQPLAIEDLIAYLVASLGGPAESRVYEVGGADQVSYGDIMREYAHQRGLRRFTIPVPVLTPYLSSLWLGLVTPVYARIGRKLIDGVRNPTVVEDPSALERFSVRPRGIRNAIARALVNEDREFACTRWSDALSSGGDTGWWGEKLGSRLVDSRVRTVSADASQAFAPIRRLGGEVGWYGSSALWRMRGFLDLLVGGVGSRRGRRDPEHLRPGDTLDFWRVEAVEPDRLLRLAAEMKLPGRAWLQFEVERGESSTEIRQTALFDPRGLFGLLYWYALYPVHQFVFDRLLQGIVARIREGAGDAAEPGVGAVPESSGGDAAEPTTVNPEDARHVHLA
jgi:uncharacterized protein YbjT (DUF2867 family)